MAGRRTLAREVMAEGVALPAGVTACMKLCPAAAGTGIVFRRSDVLGSAAIPALWSHVAETRLGAVLKGADGTSVAVVEHLLAALSCAEIDDCEIEIDGPELPALDGDALAFLTLIDKGGVREQMGTRTALAVKRAGHRHLPESVRGLARLATSVRLPGTSPGHPAPMPRPCGGEAHARLAV